MESRNTAKNEKIARSVKWHKVGVGKDVKRSVTYREITIAVGIVVALVIALTLWRAETPGEYGLRSHTGSGTAVSSRTSLPADLFGGNLFELPSLPRIAW